MICFSLQCNSYIETKIQKKNPVKNVIEKKTNKNMKGNKEKAKKNDISNMVPAKVPQNLKILHKNSW